MTKDFGQDFDFDRPSRDGGKKANGLAYRLLPKAVDFVIPVLLGLAALYVGKYWLGGGEGTLFVGQRRSVYANATLATE